MWSDRDTPGDYLNFTAQADATARFIAGAEGKAMSLGVFGPRGSGKTTLARLIRARLEAAAAGRYSIVQISCWIPQGFEPLSVIETCACALAGTSNAPSAQTAAPVSRTDRLREIERHLTASGTTLVLIVDDLDWCTPAAVMRQLEELELIGTIPGAVRIIAADDVALRNAIRSSLDGSSPTDSDAADRLAKIVNVPVHVPQPGQQELRSYLMLLFAERSGLDPQTLERARATIVTALDSSWRGERIDSATLKALIPDRPPGLDELLPIADAIASTLAMSRIGPNPRRIKRYLNAFTMALAAAVSRQLPVSAPQLAKLLLLKEGGSPETFNSLAAEVFTSEDGTMAALGEWERELTGGSRIQLPAAWDGALERSWIALAPSLAGVDLRAALHLLLANTSTAALPEPLPKPALEAFRKLIAQVDSVDTAAVDAVRDLAPAEQSLVCERILQRARQVQIWGAPPILYACMALAAAAPTLAAQVMAFLRSLPPDRLSPSLVLKLADRPWAKDVLDHWADHTDTPGRVKRAIAYPGRARR